MANTMDVVLLGDDDTYDFPFAAHVVSVPLSFKERMDEGEEVHGHELIESSQRTVTVDALIRIAEGAADYIRAVTRGQLLEWIHESGENLVNTLAENEFLTSDERFEFLDGEID